MAYAYKSISSPVGRLKLVASERGLAAILWENGHRWRNHNKAAKAACASHYG